MKTLITGWSGFIGSHLIEKVTGEIFCAPREYLLDRHALTGYLRNIQPDYIYHLASAGTHSHKDVYSINCRLFENLFYATEHIPYTGFITIGTALEQGKNASVDEYTKSKMWISSHVTQIQRPIRVARLSHVYGKGDASSRFLPSAIRALTNKQPFSYCPTVQNDWVYVKDVVDALLLIMRTIETVPKIINVSSGVVHTNQQVIDILEEMLQADRSLLDPSLQSMYETGAVENRVLRQLGWKQQYSIRTGLRELLDGSNSSVHP